MTVSFGVVIQCSGCGQWRHKSWFDMGERHCKACQEEEKPYLDRLAEAAARWDREASTLKGDMLVIAEGEKPESITGQQWRIIHMLNRGLSAEAIAISHGITVTGAMNMERDAMAALYNEAARRRLEPSPAT